MQNTKMQNSEGSLGTTASGHADGSAPVETSRYSNNPPTAHPAVRGKCPACGSETLFLGSNGYVTCSVLACKDPGAPHDVLSQSRRPVAWSEWGDGHDYSRSGKHDPNECRSCLRFVIEKLEAQPFADRMVKAEAGVSALVAIARNAVNGWACYAKRKIEHDEIAWLHAQIDEFMRQRKPATNGSGLQAQDSPIHKDPDNHGEKEHHERTNLGVPEGRETASEK